MNMATQRGKLTRQRALQHISLPMVRLPIYLPLMLLVFSFMAVLVIGWTNLLRQDVQPMNLFSEYADILPGQSRSAVIAKQFSCKTVNQAYEPYCVRAPKVGHFSLVTATFSGDVVRRVDFMVRDGALVVGELPLTWGRPHIQVYGHSVNLDWPRIGVTANGWAQNGRFSYFVPVTRLSITSVRAGDS